MKSWEFLLQKEGDRTWLPLENPTVEILEGRYRVVARTPCAKEEVDIYVSFVSSEDDPPKRRIQQRSHSANDDGLLAILPFTPFRPGRWELRCRPHVEAGDVAQQWQSQIELQVLPQESPGDDDLFGWDQPQDDALDSQVTATDAPSVMDEPVMDEPGMDGPEPSIAEPMAEPSSPIGEEAAAAALSAAELDPAKASDADIQRLATEMSQMVVESVIDADAVAESDATGDEAQSAGADPAATLPNLPSPGFTTAAEVMLESSTVDDASPDLAVEGPGIAIALEDDVVMMDGDRRVTVRGQILRPTPPLANPADALLPSELLLILELRDPSTTEIWASHRESFRQAMAPLSFASELQLPVACRTQLFLGNATLWQVEEDGNLGRLVSKDFNAMAAVDDLLDHARQTDAVVSSGLREGAVSNLQQQAASNFLVTKFGAKPSLSKGNVQINTELLNLLKPTSRTAENQTSEGAAPPARRLTAARPAGKPRVELPNFGNAKSVELPLADSLADDLAQNLTANSVDDFGLDPGAFAGETLEAEIAPSGEAQAAAQTSDLPLEMGEDNPFALPLGGDLDSLVSVATADGPPATDLALDSTETPLAEELGQASAWELGSPEGSNLSAAPADDFGEPPSLLSGGLDGAGGLALANDSVMAPAHGAVVDEVASLSSPAGLAHEVVVDDEETVAPAKLAWMQPSSSEGLVDEDISVPVPELTVPEVELIKGETVRIQVRVACSPARLCARVWLLDCQSRTLLGEPQWITAFLPLGDDLMEANVDLVVPEGSIELQVEAIAVEPITQRESRKVSTRRKVSLGSDGPDLENW